MQGSGFHNLISIKNVLNRIACDQDEITSPSEVPHSKNLILPKNSSGRKFPQVGSVLSVGIARLLARHIVASKQPAGKVESIFTETKFKADAMGASLGRLTKGQTGVRIKCFEHHG
jgi:hypothetical protein